MKREFSSANFWYANPWVSDPRSPRLGGASLCPAAVQTSCSCRLKSLLNQHRRTVLEATYVRLLALVERAPTLQPSTPDEGVSHEVVGWGGVEDCWKGWGRHDAVLFVTGEERMATHQWHRHATAQHSSRWWLGLYSGGSSGPALGQVMRRRTAQHSTAQHSTAQHSTAQHSAAQHSTALHCTALRGVVWCGVVWCGVVWCGVVWCGVPKALLPKGKRPGYLPTGTGKRAGLCVLCARCA